MVGVSADKPETQMKFVDKFQLTFPMIPDVTKEIIAAYGAHAVLTLAVQRSTFLVDPEGRIAWVWPKVSVKGHAQDVVETIARLAAERG